MSSQNNALERYKMFAKIWGGYSLLWGAVYVLGVSTVKYLDFVVKPTMQSRFADSQKVPTDFYKT